MLQQIAWSDLTCFVFIVYLLTKYPLFGVVVHEKKAGQDDWDLDKWMDGAEKKKTG